MKNIQASIDNERKQLAAVKKLQATYKKPKRTPKRNVTNRKPKDPKVRHYHLYGLELEGGFYYVGMTTNPAARYLQHLDGTGAKWTKLHKPIRSLEVRDIGICTHSTAIKAENLMVREYMNLYGLYRVRGGDLCYVKDALVALHFNDNGVKTVFYDYQGKKISRSHKRLKRMEKIQEQIANDLRWIYQ
jgi:predicted GIY-YIG superfamily endonuclease